VGGEVVDVGADPAAHSSVLVELIVTDRTPIRSAAAT
jgi:hypothetical protein